jgi:nicotinamide-nucleotide amidase
MNIQLLLTGNEIMSGDIVDSNSAMIAELLATEGYVINRKVTIGDELEGLVEELQQLAAASDVLIVNGGLGPTIDDLTAQALGIVTGQELVNNEIAYQHLQMFADRYGLSLNAANLKQALLPAGVAIIPNPVGTAVGFSIEHNDCLILCTPGVPGELKKMMTESVLPMICQRHPNNAAVSTLRLQTFGLGESNLQQLLSSDYPDWPKEVELGFRASIPLLEVKLTIHTPDHLSIQQQCHSRLKSLIGDYIVGEGNTNLAASVIALLGQKQQQLTTAESCTGGLIAASITEIAGASAVFEAGFVTYSNAMKQQLLGVTEQQLSDGAVSEATVKAMAKGALANSAADYAIAVSGVAGPEGGSEQKPVGTVWIAWGSKQQIHTKQLLFRQPRKRFQQLVAATALDLLRREILGISSDPLYFTSRAAKA